MAGFKCPFCGQMMSTGESTLIQHYMDFVEDYPIVGRPQLEVNIYKCPNERCQKETIIARGVAGYIENQTVFVYPQAIYQNYPDYIPLGIRQDYVEACCIKDKSPKAAATLARRCLQGMIRDFWGIKGKRTLAEEISAIEPLIPESQWNAINALRNIGNIGAHMERDVNLIIDVDPYEADQLIRFIELLIDKWYISRHDEEVLMSSITAISESKKTDRK